MKKIKYYDLIAPSEIHTEFNSAMVQVLMLALKGCKHIDCYAETEHISILKQKLIAYNQIRFHCLNLLPKSIGGGIKTPLRDILSCIYVWSAFLRSRKTDLLFFALAYPFAHYTIYALNSLFRRNVIVVQHGELEAIVNSKHFERNSKYYSIIKPLLKNESNIRYAVLGKPIFDNVQHLFGHPSKVIVIDHPYDFGNETTIETVSNFAPLVIGQIGTGKRNKGVVYLFKLAELLKNEIENGLLKIKLIGKLPQNLMHLDNNLVEYSKAVMSVYSFQKEIESISFALLLRDNNMGKAIASGTFWDAIKYRKPFLSLENDYVRYYTQHNKGGSFFNSTEAMAEFIRFMLHNKEETITEYSTMVEGIKQIRKEFSLDVIAKQLKNQL